MASSSRQSTRAQEWEWELGGSTQHHSSDSLVKSVLLVSEILGSLGLEGQEHSTAELPNLFGTKDQCSYDNLMLDLRWS